MCTLLNIVQYGSNYNTGCSTTKFNKVNQGFNKFWWIWKLFMAFSMFPTLQHLTYDPWILSKVKSMASTASNRQIAKNQKKWGFLMIHSTLRDRFRSFCCQGWWNHQAQFFFDELRLSRSLRPLRLFRLLRSLRLQRILDSRCRLECVKLTLSV